MKLLLIRHGKAEDRRLFFRSAKKDAARALTETGRREMRKVGKGLRKLAPDIDVLATSPLARARETAGIVAKLFGVRDVVEQALLSPGVDVQPLLDWLRQQPPDGTVALVGHEPDLGRFASYLMAANAASFVAFKKGACCLIEFAGKPERGRGTLAWLLPPGALRKLGG